MIHYSVHGSLCLSDMANKMSTILDEPVRKLGCKKFYDYVFVFKHFFELIAKFIARIFRLTN